MALPRELAEGVHREEGVSEGCREAEVLAERVPGGLPVAQALPLAGAEGDRAAVGVAPPARLREAAPEAVREGVALLQGCREAVAHALGEREAGADGVAAVESVGESVPSLPPPSPPPAEAVGLAPLCVAACQEAVAQALALPPAPVLLGAAERLALPPEAVALGRALAQEDTLAVALAPPGREAEGV